MRATHKVLSLVGALVLGVATAAAPAAADAPALRFGVLKQHAAAPSLLNAPTLRSWMNPEIGDAWRQGFTGRGATITVVDDFRSGSVLRGNLGSGIQSLRHGEWTRGMAGMIAPSAGSRTHDFLSGRSVGLGSGLNVVNLSYGMFGPPGSTTGQIRWSAQESSLIGYARDGRAVVSKSAGNDGVAVGAPNARGSIDHLNAALVGTRSAIFVGALTRNGSVGRPATMASYSNVAGANATVQRQFLVVGVEGQTTGLHGTSFAAPIVSGYAAVLGSKFTKASPTQIANQLLSTARRDTIANYNAAVHGRGEASIQRALAPVSIR